MGYRVYVSNHDAGEFLQITTTWVKDTVFHHPINLNNLGEQIYFKVKAIDNRENYSDASASVAVERPDIIPPSPPNITSFEAKMQGIDLAWLGSSSKDVVKHQLQRKAMHEASWEVIYDSSNDDFTNNYLDSDASYKYLYQYRLVAFDDADLSSSSKIMTIQPLDNGIRPEIQDVNSDIEVITVDIDDVTGAPTLTTSAGVNVDVVTLSGPIYVVSSTPTSGQQPAPSTFGVVRLRWSYFDEAVPCGLHSFQVYRATNDGQMRAFKTIFPDSGALSSSGNMITYGMRDAEVSSGNTYTYQIMAKYTDGAYSPMSEQTLVTY
jgi:hypothetical protein